MKKSAGAKAAISKSQPSGSRLKKRYTELGRVFRGYESRTHSLVSPFSGKTIYRGVRVPVVQVVCPRS